MKKKYALGFLGAVEVASLICIYVLGGRFGAWAWSINSFVIGPLAAVGVIVTSIILFIRLSKRQSVRWSFLYMIVLCLMAYPITILVGVSPITYPHHADDQAIRIINPVEGAVWFGGEDYTIHALWPSECYAYDLVKYPYNLDSHVLSDYGIYMTDVLSPIAGKVTEVKDYEDDIVPNTEDFLSLLGNYIVIEVEETGTYLILAHLEKNSITVAVGDYVSAGIKIAKVGNSGTTSEPHLHIQHQKENPEDIPIAICAQGLPIEWHDEE